MTIKKKWGDIAPATMVCSFHKRKFGNARASNLSSLFCQIESCHNIAEFMAFKTTLEITGVEL